MFKLFRLFRFINLHQGEEDKQTVLENVTANISFRGSNLWILSCAIVIASIGLNVNSTAVVIGAMLISPLMGPIVGAGFALGTYNFPLLKRSIKNLLIATVVSLTVSFLYFTISPFKDTQSELLARTSPNIYDVLIAFFGGLVGVIAITRVEKGNPIPGVAIATALMPPLCTAGYGLAIGNLSYFGGAFYLYTINCFFICIATFLIIKYLKYPAADWVDRKQERRIRYGITTLIIVMIVPSFYLAYSLLNEKRYKQDVDQFITTQFSQKGYTTIYKKVNYNNNPRTIELAFLEKKIDTTTLKELNTLLPEYGLDNTQLIVKQDATDLKSEILQEIGQQNNVLSEKDLMISKLRQSLNQYTVNDSGLVQEIRILFPEVQHIAIGKVTYNARTDSAYIGTVVLYHTAEAPEALTEQRMQRWLAAKLSDTTLNLIRR